MSTVELKTCGTCKWYHQPAYLLLEDATCEIPARAMALPLWLSAHGTATRKVRSNWENCPTHTKRGA